MGVPRQMHGKPADRPLLGGLVGSAYLEKARYKAGFVVKLNAFPYLTREKTAAVITRSENSEEDDYGSDIVVMGHRVQSFDATPASSDYEDEIVYE
jgi:hypothetical protein